MKQLAPACITRYHAHHYPGFAATHRKLFHKEEPPRVKPLLYIYRVLLTGAHLMRTGQVEANLAALNASVRLLYLDELIERKRSGPEQGTLAAADVAFHDREHDRLASELEAAVAASTLPDQPTAKPALGELLIRIRLGRVAV